jgi:ribonuclease Z
MGLSPGDEEGDPGIWSGPVIIAPILGQGDDPMFELVFLGTAAAVPSAERGLPALLVGRGRDRLLVDCGEGAQRQLLRAGLGFRGLGQVLLTHAHLDHVAGLAGLVATRALWGLGDAIEVIGSGETIEFMRRYLAVTVGAERESCYRLRAVSPGPVLSRPGWRLDAFAVTHRNTQSLGYRFAEEARRPLLAERLAALAVPEGPARRALAAGRAVTLGDGRLIAPEMVRGSEAAGAKLAVVGDVEEVASLTQQVRAADALVIEATFLDRDNALARSRGHLTARAAAWLAREAEIGELLLTHISGRYRPEEIKAEAASLFPRTRVVADFDRISVAARSVASTVDT